MAKAKAYDKNYPFCSKTRDLLISKKGKKGSIFKFKVGVVEASLRAKWEAQWRREK